MPVPKRASDVERRSLRTVAAERIRGAIFDGTLQPGERLLDQELQDWLGISRTPLREGLNDLARVGLVEMAAQRYTRVAVAQPEDRKAILQTLGALIGGVARVTTSELTDDQRSAIDSTLDDLMNAVADRATHTHGKRGWELVELFIDACPNPYFVRATRETADALAYQLSVTRTESSTSWGSLEDGYPRLRDAVARRDAIAAELAFETVFEL